MCLELQNKKLLVWKKGQGQDVLDGFSHLAYAGVRELVRTQGLSHEGHTVFMTCRHSGTLEYRYLNACDCVTGIACVLKWGVALRKYIY